MAMADQEPTDRNATAHTSKHRISGTSVELDIAADISIGEPKHRFVQKRCVQPRVESTCQAVTNTDVDDHG